MKRWITDLWRTQTSLSRILFQRQRGDSGANCKTWLISRAILAEHTHTITAFSAGTSSGLSLVVPLCSLLQLSDIIHESATRIGIKKKKKAKERGSVYYQLHTLQGREPHNTQTKRHRSGLATRKKLFLSQRKTNMSSAGGCDWVHESVEF